MPSVPRNLTVPSKSGESIELKWDVPEDDGGTEITNYVIERREATRNTWNNATTTLDLEFTVTKIIEGKSYYCRVAAQNEVGVGPYAELPEPVVAKSLFGTYGDVDGVTDDVKYGEQIWRGYGNGMAWGRFRHYRALS